MAGAHDGGSAPEVAIHPQAPARSRLAASARAVLPVVVAALIIIPSATLYVLGVYQPTYNTPHTALAGVSHRRARSPLTPGLARHVTVIVVDGISAERAREIEGLRALRRQGVMRGLTVAFPSYTSPGITSMVTGLEPRDSGVRLNGANVQGVSGLDSLLLAAADTGVAVRVRSRGWPEFAELVRAEGGMSGPARLGPATHKKDDGAAARHEAQPGHARPGMDVQHGRLVDLYETAVAMGRLGPEAPPLDGQTPTRGIKLVYVGEADEEAHAHGLSSPGYAEAERLAGAMVARHAAALDLRQDTLIVLSDHGQLPQGGHGGDEPAPMQAFFFAAGGFVRRGVELGDRPMRDVASTIAVIAGLPVPSSNLGRPMLDILPLSDDEHAALLTGPFEQAHDLLCRVAPSPRCSEAGALLDRLRRGDPDAAVEAEALLDAIHAARTASLEASEETGRVTRVALALLVFAGAAALSLLIRRRQLGAPVAAPIPRAAIATRAAWIATALLPIVQWLVYAAVLRGIGYGLSFSRMAPGNVFMSDSTIAGGVALVAVVILAWIGRAVRLAPWVLLAGAVVPFVLMAAWAGASHAALPPPLGGIALFLSGPCVIGASLSAIAVAALGAWRERAPEPQSPSSAALSAE